MALTEEQLLDAVYSLYETDDSGWDSTSTEYLTARKYANAAINMWEHYDNTTWRELWTTLTAATQEGLVKSTVADTYTYTCPTNFIRPASWVRIGGEFYNVISPEKVGHYASSDEKFCYFTGSPKDGYTLHLNPRLTIPAGLTIEYEYYKSASTFTATSSTTEMSDPYMIVYFVLYRLLKNDGEDYGEERDIYESKLENMATENLSGVHGVADSVLETVEGGFGQ